MLPELAESLDPERISTAARRTSDKTTICNNNMQQTLTCFVVQIEDMLRSKRDELAGQKAGMSSEVHAAAARPGGYLEAPPPYDPMLTHSHSALPPNAVHPGMAPAGYAAPQVRVSSYSECSNRHAACSAVRTCVRTCVLAYTTCHAISRQGPALRKHPCRCAAAPCLHHCSCAVSKRGSLQAYHTAPPALAPGRYDAMEYSTLSHSSQDMLPQHSAMMASQRKAGGSMGAPPHPAAALPPKSSSRQRGMSDAAAAQAAMAGPPMVGAYGGGMPMHPGYGAPPGVRGAPPGAGQVQVPLTPDALHASFADCTTHRFCCRVGVC